MKPEFKSLPSFWVVGIKWQGQNGPEKIPGIWDKFVPMIAGIRPEGQKREAFGVERNFDAATGEFEYLACMPTTEDAPVPDGMEKWQVPAADYAVFPATLATIGETYTYVLRDWIGKQGYEHGPGSTIEHYDETFDGSKTSEFKILFPIKKMPQ